MAPSRTRLAVVLLGDRLVAAAVAGARSDVFSVDADQPAAALRAELDQRRLRPRTVALGLPRASVVVKTIALPDVGGEVREMVRFELERHVPFPTEDAPFDFAPLPRRAASPGDPPAVGHHVLVAAADRRVVDGALRLADEARLRPESVTVAAHDLLTLATLPRHGRVVWIHRVGDAAEVLFVAGGALATSRHLPLLDGAPLAEEIKRTFALIRWRACDAIWVSGDPSPSLTPQLSQLGPPIDEPAYTRQARQRLASVTDVSRGAAELAIAVASARRIARLDLLPPALRPRRVTRGQAMTLVTLAATVILAVGAFLAPGHRQTRDLEALNARVRGLDAEVKEIEGVLRELERKRALVTTIESLEASALRPLPVLRELTEALPADAWLTSLSLDVKGVELTGQAAAASALIPLLENSPRLERAEFASPVTRGRDKEQFRIRAAWEGGSVAAAARSAQAAPAPAAPAASAPRPAARPGLDGRATGDARSGDTRVLDAPAADLPEPLPRRAPAAPPGPTGTR
jgi:Tfp pilus assembly protein PilN